MTTQPCLPMYESLWIPIKDGDISGLAIYRRHYTAKKNPRPRKAQFVGPYEHMALLSPCARALFVWTAPRYRADAQEGINCSVFRNEGAGLSSSLIIAAERHAWERWPGQRLYTFVDADQVSSPNPGWCFLMAGWRKLPSRSKGRRLLIFEKMAA
jgi:hypothetical protein